MLRFETIVGLSAFLVSFSDEIPQKKINSTGKQGCCSNCIFPYKVDFWKYVGGEKEIIDDREYYTCTNIFDEMHDIDPDVAIVGNDPDKYICASEVNSTGYMTGWDYCDTCCPGASVESTPQMEADPKNEERNYCSCGVHNPSSLGKIVGGSEAGIGAQPWQVAILHEYPQLFRQGCGGTLISDKYVVTAAHCTYYWYKEELFVRVGDTILATEFEAEAYTYGVDEIIEHPNYDPVTYSHDISILVLDDYVDLNSHPNIKPACLFPKPYTSGEAIVSGWGEISSPGTRVSHLREVNVNVFANGDCGSMNSEMDDSMLCAGYMAGGKDACQYDSGGPLIAHAHFEKSYSLTGVVSWGYGCADPDSLGIYANVSKFYEWISQNTPDWHSCPPADLGLDLESAATAAPAQPCFPKNRMVIFKPYEKIKKVVDAQACSDLCTESKENGNDCQYFNFKDHNSKSKRICYLLRVEAKKKNNFYSGPEGCSLGLAPEPHFFDTGIGRRP